ncbi:MAG: hypothetical protein ACRELF_15745, partial [Gemmataceae bacterium]
MPRIIVRIIPYTAILVSFACYLGAVSGIAHGQEATTVPLPPTVSTEKAEETADQAANRLSRIEDHLRKLEEHNRHLQKQYSSLKEEYEKILKRYKSPVFGADAKNPDGMGIPGGVELGPDAPAMKGAGKTGDGEE